MEARELRALSNDELQGQLEDNYRRLFAYRRDLASRRLEDYNQVKAVKREIARIKTILRERELAKVIEEAA